MKKPIYLDYNGTTPHGPEVIEAMRPYFETEFGNPSSAHWFGASPREAVSFARKQVAELLCCSADEVLFTSGGTESNNHALKGFGGAKFRAGNHLITSNIEHPAITEVCRYMAGNGFDITWVEADAEGLVNAADVAAAIKPETVMISIMYANNEVGTLQPVEEISGLVADSDILFHTDAAQAVGKISTDVVRLGVDLLSVAGHKLYAPKGIGALYVRDGVEGEVFCHGASQESGKRGGTENVMEIVGLGAACRYAHISLAAHKEHLQAMRDRLEKGLDNLVADIRFNGHREKRLPNTASISFAGVDADQILHEVGDNLAVSAGAACHSHTVHISHVLKAMGLAEEWAKGTIRFSTGRMSTAEEIDQAVALVAKAVKKLRG